MLIGAMSVAPFLYLVAFGFALGQEIEIAGHPYIQYLLPGLVALSSMTQAFAISGEINIARFYWKIFEEFQAAPVSRTAYVAAEVLAAMTRGIMAAVVILVLGFLFGIQLYLGPAFWLAVAANSFVFGSLAVFLAMVVREHAAQMMLNTFIITPMAFLGGTFFPAERLPAWTQHVIEVLPITHAARAIRDAALISGFSWTPYLVMASIGGAFFVLALSRVHKM
jgi:ABC-type multidrug transport system permease subunit